MSNVTLVIGGRNFIVACAKGEEEHIAELGRMLDDKLKTLSNATSFSEPRMLLFGALLLADELHELRSAPPLPSQEAPAAEETASLLDGIATQLEKLAEHLESQPTAP